MLIVRFKTPLLKHIFMMAYQASLNFL